MTHPPPALGLPRPPRSRALVALLLALLVQGLGLALLQRERQRPAAPPRQALLELRLVVPKPQRPPAVSRQLPPPARPPTGRTTQDEEPPRSVLSADVPAVMPVPSAEPQPAPVPSTARPALNLALPAQRAASGPRTETMLQQVRRDPRANSARRTLEDAIADGAGTLPVTVGASTDGTASTIVRQGSRCVRISEARIRTLNPMDENARATPSVSGSCFKD